MGVWRIPGEDRDEEEEIGGSREMREMKGRMQKKKEDERTPPPTLRPGSFSFVDTTGT